MITRIVAAHRLRLFFVRLPDQQPGVTMCNQMTALFCGATTEKYQCSDVT